MRKLDISPTIETDEINRVKLQTNDQSYLSGSDDSGLENSSDNGVNRQANSFKRRQFVKTGTKLKGSYVDGSDSGDYSGDSSGNESLEKRGKVTDRAHQTDRGTIRKGINYDSDQTKSTSSSSESNVTEPVSETSSFTIHPDDSAFDDICTDLLAKHVMKNKAGIRAVTDIAKFKLKESLAGVKVKVGFVGEPGCGKTSLIEAIFGEEIPAKKMEKKKQENKEYMTFKYPGWRNIKFAEIPAVKTHRRVEREAYLEAMNITGYDLIVIVTENHIREWAMWMARELEKQEIPFIFVRTKIDKTASEDKRKFPRTFCERRVVKQVRDRCEESITGAKLPQSKTFVISTVYPDKWDFRALVQALGEDLSRTKKRSLNLSLPPLTPHLISEKQKAHAQHIWMISALSVASGLMEIPGFAISADIELLRQEIDNYRKSLGITDEIITKLCDDEENPALEAAWELIFYDDGIHSILRQTAMELDPEDLINFAKKIPILGGGISFPATCRYKTYPKSTQKSPKL